MGSSTGAAGRGESKSPKQSNKPSPECQDAPADSTANDAGVKPEPSGNAEAPKPLAPPPRPGQQQGTDTPDFFNSGPGGSLSLEPNPFEQSFGIGNAPQDTPGKLPPVAALTSPSSLLPGGGVTPFGWGGGSLRTGPLSPAMLSGPQGDYFGDHHIRASFPTPNESSLRTGLTPGGSGSMFPAQSPNSQALFAQLATPGAIDFHRTALSAAAAKREQAQAQPQQSVTSQPQEVPNGTAPVPVVKSETKPSTGQFDPHDNDAANGLFMLAQGRNGAHLPNHSSVAPAVQPPTHAHPAPIAPVQQMNGSPQMNGNGSVGNHSVRGVSEAASGGSDESVEARPNTRNKNKRNSGGAVTNGRRKAEDAPAKGHANKKAKTNGAAMSMPPEEDDMSDEDMGDHKDDPNNPKSKMTDEEKRKNFLERNRVAALKCRQRKKQWLANLQSKVEMYSSENDALTAQISQLREEVVNLKTLLLAHKDCPVTQQQGLHNFMQAQPPMEPYSNPQMNPYGMAAPMPQPVMAGQPVTRRFS